MVGLGGGGVGLEGDANIMMYAHNFPLSKGYICFKHTLLVSTLFYCTTLLVLALHRPSTPPPPMGGAFFYHPSWINCMVRRWDQDVCGKDAPACQLV